MLGGGVCGQNISPLLEDQSFTLRTDNAALAWLDKFRDEKGQLARCAMLLRGFQFTVEQVHGKNNERDIKWFLPLIR
jgi:hypothetical protein